jgi:hypothetical protein
MSEEAKMSKCCAREREGGMTLILVIGVIATLAILAAGLVVLTANVQSNTAHERTRTKAFDVAEGALDVGMNTLAVNWPSGTNPAPTWNATGFRSLEQFANAAEYPNPKSGLGSFSGVQFYDDDQPDGGYVAATSPHTDANNNDLMWLVSRGATGSRVAVVQAKVHRNPMNTGFPHGIAVYVGGMLDPNAPGNIKKGMFHVEDQGSAASVNGYATTFGPKLKSDFEKDGSIYVFDSGIAPHVVDPQIGDPPVVPPITSLIDPGIISGITALAQSMGRYYDVTQGDAIPNDKSGITVIRTDGAHPVSLGNDSINTLTSPGILLILRNHTASPDPEPTPGVTFDMGGNGKFYGVLYVEGAADTSHGTPEVHGMLACVTNMTMQGTPDVYYNDSVITALSNKWTLTVSLVPNTWRELQSK